MNIFNLLLVNPIINILVVIYQGLVALHVPYALGFSIILLTVVIRAILYPLIHSQLKTSKKMQEITPHLNRLKEQHKNDATKLQAETMKLYQEHGVNPVAGCLPLLIQLPLIWGLYGVLQQVVKTDPTSVLQYVNHALYVPSMRLSHMWDTSFFGLSLGNTPSHLLPHVGFGILLIPVLTGVFQLVQSKMMFSTPEQTNLPAKQGQKKEDDFASAFQTQSMYIFPLMIAFFSWTLPVGLSLYWNTFTIFGILQQYQISGFGGLSEWINKVRPNK